MRVIILGSAAGGGLPQWNCGCPNCDSARRGGEVASRTQDSVAVSADGQHWVLLNASPDVLRQAACHRELWPRSHDPRHRGSPISGIVLTDGELDHCLGLLSLREWTPLSLFATRQVLSDLLERNALFRTLQREHGQLAAAPLPLGRFTSLTLPNGDGSGLALAAFPVHGKVPRHLRGSSEPSPETTIGVLVREEGGGAMLAYVPAAATLDAVEPHLGSVDCLLFDGTFWSDDEPAAVGIASTARGMAHVPILQGSLHWHPAGVRHRYYTHINNTNPILRPRSSECRKAAEAGWQIAHDGLRIEL